MVAVVAVGLTLAACASAATLDGVRASGSATSSSTSTTAAEPTTLVEATPTTTVPPEPVHKVLLLGDSVMWDAAPTIVDGFRAAGIEVNSQAFPGTSLLGKTDIRATFRQVVAEVQPDVVVAEYSGVYLPPFPTAADGREILLGTPEFWDAWEAAVVDATRALSSSGARVYWVLLPHDETTWEARSTGLNDAYLGAADAAPGVGYIDWRTPISGVFGAPIDEAPIGPGGTLVPVRGPDGRHFSHEASIVLAGVVVDTVLGR